MDVSKAWGQVLKKNRKAAGLSQESLAHECELDRTFISLLERGKRQPSLATIFQIAKALNIRPAQLVEQVDRLARRSRRRYAPRHFGR